MSTSGTDLNPVHLLNTQLLKVADLRNLDSHHPEFISWHDTVTMLFQRFLTPESPHFVRFTNLRFHEAVFRPARRLPFSYRGPTPSGSSLEDKAVFQSDCDIAIGCIKGAIEEIIAFGVHTSTPAQRTLRTKSGVQQIFNAPVTIGSQAIATDSAIQSIQHVGDAGAGLKEIANLLTQTLDLTGRQKLEGLKAIEDVATEIQKPEQGRNWKFVLDSGEKLLDIAAKATDVGSKLAPYLAPITALIDQAAKHLR